MADMYARQKMGKRNAGIFDESAFSYDAVSDTYRCPAGQSLCRRNHSKRRSTYEYKAGKLICNRCPLKAQCTRSANGRSIQRHEDHELIERGRIQAASPAAHRDRRRRKHLAEGSFADAANNHHYKRSRWRRLWRQQIQDYLIAAIQNIRILLSRGGKTGLKAAAAAQALQNDAPSPFCTLLSEASSAFCSRVWLLFFGDELMHSPFSGTFLPPLPSLKAHFFPVLWATRRQDLPHFLFFG